jgi:N-acetyl sugar amidotransferase
MRWCARCVLPDTRPGLVIGDDGVCNACRAHERRPQVDWAARRRDWEEVVHDARARSAGWDCVIPVSGGKDSTWQVVTCLEAGLKPLCVTWKTPGRTVLGQRNLDSLVALGVDHVDWQVSPAVEARFMVLALERAGIPGLPMHMALFAIPLTLAVRYRIPLVVWGENSAAEYGTTDERLTGARLDAAWLARYGVTGGTTWRDWVGEELSERDLAPYRGPDPEELEAADVRAVFLGHYFPWDPERTYEVARAHGFTPAEIARTGLYAFADVDDDFISVHHYLKWPKFGFTRTFDNLALEIRNGRLTRDEAVAVLRERGEETPHEDIERWCAFAGIPRARFDAAVERWRNLDVWALREDGVWWIPDFLIPDWRWT